MAGQLDGRNVAVFIAQHGTEQVEFTEPKSAVSDAGASVTVLSSETSDADTVNNDFGPGDSFAVDATFADASDRHRERRWRVGR
jgi:protease I